LSAAYSIVRKRNLTPHRVKKTAQAWKIISFAGINTSASIYADSSNAINFAMASSTTNVGVRSILRAFLAFKSSILT